MSNFSKIMICCVVVTFATIITMIRDSYYSDSDILPKRSQQRTDIKVMLYSIDGCIYCINAEKFLKKKLIPYNQIKLQQDPELAAKLFELTGQRTVPYVFVNDKFIGGYQELLKLDEKGQL